MKMKTCQQCGRRRPLKKLDVSSAQHFTKTVLCKDVTSCVLVETGGRVKAIPELPQKYVTFVDEYTEVAGEQYHMAMHLFNRKPE